MSSGRKRPFAVYGLPKGVEDPAKPVPGRPDCRLGVGRLGLAPKSDPLEGPEGQQQGPAAAKSDDLAGDPEPTAGHDIAAVAYGKHPVEPGYLNQHAKHPDHPPVEANIWELIEPIDQISDRSRHLRPSNLPVGY